MKKIRDIFKKKEKAEVKPDKIYEFTLKTPVFLIHEGKNVKLLKVSISGKPGYHIEEGVVYVLIWDGRGLPLMLPIVESPEEFRAIIEDKNE